MSGSGIRSFAVPAIRRLALVGAISGALLSPLALGLGTAVAAENPCATAAALIADEEPAKAVALIEAIREDARAQLDAGVDAGSGDSPPTTEEQEALRDRAGICPDEYDAAQVAIAAEKPAEPAGNERAGKNWDAFVKTYVAPLVAPGTAALGIFVGLLIVSRLMILLPGFPWIKRPHRLVLRLLYAVGLVTLGWVAWQVALHTTQPAAAIAKEGWGWVGTLLPVAIVGAALVAAFLGGRTRINIEVLDEEGAVDKAASSAIIATITEFGASEPSGVEVPTAPDLGDLKGAVVTDLPGGQLLSAVVGAVQTLFGIVPWTVTISRPTATQAAVVIRRNGSTFSATTLDLADYPPLHAAPAQGDVDLRPGLLNTLAAGHVIAALSSRSRGFGGLYGASDGTAIGLYSIAGKHDNKNASIALLAAALDRDSEAYLAELALLHARLRRATTRDDLAQFEKKLRWHLGERRLTRRSARQLRSRTLYVHMIAARNYLAARVTKADGADTEAAIRAFGLTSATQAVQLLRRKARTPHARMMQMLVATSLGVLAHHVDPDTEFAVPRRLFRRQFSPRHVKLATTLKMAEEWKDEALNSSAPEVAYDTLCYLIRTGQNVGETARERNAWRIRVSVNRPDELEWIGDDPELATVRKESWFVAAVKRAAASIADRTPKTVAAPTTK